MTEIPQLERGLVDAARRRARRRPRSLRWPAALVAAAAAAAFVVVALGGDDVERAATPPPPGQDYEDAVSAALGVRDPSCEPVSRETRLVDDPPEDATLAAFAALRRAPSAKEADPAAHWRIGSLAGVEILERAVRRLDAADGTPYLLAVTRGPFAERLADAGRCNALRHEAFDRAASGLSPEARERGAFMVDRNLHDDRGAAPDEEYIGLYRLNPDGTANGGLAERSERVRRDGLLFPEARGLSPITRTLGGLVPDGVAEVVVSAPPEGGGPARSVRATVRGNVFRVELPAGSGPDTTTTFLDPDGRRLRQVPLDFGD